MKVGDRVKVVSFTPMVGEKGVVVSVTKLYMVKLDNGLAFELREAQVVQVQRQD